MPAVKIKEVHCYSSEDSNHPAKNLLGSDPVKKWKCLKSGEQSASIVLELERLTKITEIVIGNECSAFIEVLVAKKGPSELVFKEIILTSSFMTPYESRNTSNCNRVRNFSSPALIEHVAKEKWDLIKFICTQPFNRHIKYGISFIKLYTKDQVINDKKNDQIDLIVMDPKTPTVPQKDNANNNNAKPSKITQLGRFNIREESSDSDSDTKNSLFTRWKQKNDITSTASAIREASSSPNLIIKPKLMQQNKRENEDSNNNSNDGKTDIKNRNHNRLIYNDEDDKPNDKVEKKMSRDKEKEDKERTMTEKDKEKKKDKSETTGHSSRKHHSSSPSKHSSSSSSSKRTHDDSQSSRSSKTQPSPSASSHSSSSGNHRKRSSSSTHSHEIAKKQKTSETILYKPFNKLLENVIFVISGLQNPERGIIRQQALELGAKYKSDWDSHCTHLICAFKNTPKYNQVKGKGIIIKKEWIAACYNEQKKLLCQNFALDKHDKNNKYDNGPEIFDIKLKPLENKESVLVDVKETMSELSVETPAMKKVESNEIEVHVSGDESDDTEDEIERVINNNNKIKQKSDETMLYDQSTEDDESTKPSIGAANKSFFINKKFYIDENDISTVDLIKLKRFIPLYKGEIIEDVHYANYVIAEGINILDISKETDFNGEFVKPLWIFECNDMETFIPITRYKILIPEQN